MKTLILIAVLSLLAACSSNPYQVTEQQVELSSMQSHSFCKGDRLQSYTETRNFYQFTCSDGRYFMLPKRQ